MIWYKGKHFEVYNVRKLRSLPGFSTPGSPFNLELLPNPFSLQVIYRPYTIFLFT